MNKRLTKRDLIFIVLILIVAAVCYILNIPADTDQDKMIVITVDGNVVKYCSLDHNDTIDINGGSNILKIEDGKALMIEADCPDHICINQGSIYRNKESIICLPNKVVVEIEEKSDNEIDVISK